MSRHFEGIAQRVKANGPDCAHQIKQLNAFRSETIALVRAELTNAYNESMQRHFTPEFAPRCRAKLDDLFAGIEAELDQVYPLPKARKKRTQHDAQTHT